MSLRWICLCALVILAVSDLIGSHGVDIPPSLTPGQRHTIEHFVSNLIACRQIPGFAITAVTSSEVLLRQGYGFADLENEVRVNEDTLFPIGSCSKAFTSALLSILMSEQGQGHSPQ